MVKKRFGRVVFSPTDPALLRRDLANLDAARAALASAPDCRVPDVLWQDVEAGVILQSFEPGDTGRMALRMAGYGIGDRADVLRRIGRFAGHLHRAEVTDGVGL